MYMCLMLVYGITYEWLFLLQYIMDFYFQINMKLLKLI